MSELNNQSESSAPGLKKYISPLGAWALIFGCSVGWGAFVMPGTTFLPLAGPLGAIIGLAVGAFVMLLVGVNYFFMMKRYPDAGGTYSYAKHVFGYDHGFLNAWFLVLVYLAIIWANATALTIVFRNLLGSMLQWGWHYKIAGFDVYLGEALVSDAFIIVFGLLCIRGGRLAIGVQIAMALLLFFGVLFGCGTAIVRQGGELMSIQAQFCPGRPWLVAVFNIAVLAPWAFAGFESISHSAEELRFPIRRTFAILIGSLFIIGLAYIALVVVAVSVRPVGYGNWYAYVKDLGRFTDLRSNPVLYAINSMLGEKGLFAFGCVILAGVITGLVGNYIAVSRIIYSMAKDDVLPCWFGRLNRTQTPGNALLVIMLLSLPIPFFGRTAIGWIVDVNTIGATIAYLYTSAIAFRAAWKERNLAVQLTGSTGSILSVMFFLYYMIPNVWSGGLSQESYLIFIIWSILGLVFFKYIFNKDMARKRFGGSIVIWVVMLSLIFFTSMLWLRTTTNKTTSEVLKNLDDYNVQELADHGIQLDEKDKMDAEHFIQEQMTKVNESMKYNSLIQMGLILVALIAIFNIYRSVMLREKKLEIAKAQAEERNEAKSIFLSRMSHDMRTPLNAVLGYVGLAKKKDSVSPQLADFLEKIESSAKRLLSLVNDLLEMSRLESGKVKLEIVRGDLRKIMTDMKVLFENQMESKNIDFSVTINDVTDGLVMCDMNHLDRVLLNLVSNAYKFTPEGGKVSVSLVQTGRTDTAGEYELRVKDNGLGMSSEFKARLFEAYEREDRAMNIQGTGLGMSIAKSIIDMMGGTIDVESEQGKGTEFIIRVSFPVAEPIQADAETQGQLINVVPDFTNVRLLLVDDNEINREIATMILQEAGFILDEAENGKDAVEKIASSQPGDYQAVLMDVQMPIMNGYEATKAIRALPNQALASIPIIAMTANAFSEDIQKGKDAGMNAHVAKPINVTKLMATLSDVLAKSMQPIASS